MPPALWGNLKLIPYSCPKEMRMLSKNSDEKSSKLRARTYMSADSMQNTVLLFELTQEKEKKTSKHCQD